MCDNIDQCYLMEDISKVKANGTPVATGQVKTVNVTSHVKLLAPNSGMQHSSYAMNSSIQMKSPLNLITHSPVTTTGNGATKLSASSPSAPQIKSFISKNSELPFTTSMPMAVISARSSIPNTVRDVNDDPMQKVHLFNSGVKGPGPPITPTAVKPSLIQTTPSTRSHIMTPLRGSAPISTVPVATTLPSISSAVTPAIGPSTVKNLSKTIVVSKDAIANNPSPAMQKVILQTTSNVRADTSKLLLHRSTPQSIGAPGSTTAQRFIITAGGSNATATSTHKELNSNSTAVTPAGTNKRTLITGRSSSTVSTVQTPSSIATTLSSSRTVTTVVASGIRPDSLPLTQPPPSSNTTVVSSQSGATTPVYPEPSLSPGGTPVVGGRQPTILRKRPNESPGRLKALQSDPNTESGSPRKRARKQQLQPEMRHEMGHHHHHHHHHHLPPVPPQPPPHIGMHLSGGLSRSPPHSGSTHLVTHLPHLQSNNHLLLLPPPQLPPPAQPSVVMASVNSTMHRTTTPPAVSVHCTTGGGVSALTGALDPEDSVDSPLGSNGVEQQIEGETVVHGDPTVVSNNDLMQPELGLASAPRGSPAAALSVTVASSAMTPASSAAALLPMTEYPFKQQSVCSDSNLLVPVDSVPVPTSAQGSVNLAPDEPPAAAAEEVIDSDGVKWRRGAFSQRDRRQLAWRCRWKPRQLHFERYADVRPREERRYAVQELASRKGADALVSGWRMRVLGGTSAELVTEEEKLLSTEMCRLRADFENRQMPRFNSEHAHNLNELTKGITQRSHMVIEQLTEARENILQLITKHERTALQLIEKHRTKKVPKKKEKERGAT